MNETNNEFSLIVRNSDGNLYELLLFNFVECVGNSNVYNILDELNALLDGYISVTYDKIKNYFYL